MGRFFFLPVSAVSHHFPTIFLPLSIFQIAQYGYCGHKLRLRPEHPGKDQNCMLKAGQCVDLYPKGKWLNQGFAGPALVAAAARMMAVK
jgi:hypothetical protein